MKKRLEEGEKHILTLDEITEKLTRAQILRTKMHAEKYCRAKINSIQVSKVLTRKASIERANIM